MLVVDVIALSYFSEQVYILIPRHVPSPVFVLLRPFTAPVPRDVASCAQFLGMQAPANLPWGNIPSVAESCPTEHEWKVFPLWSNCSPFLYLLALLHLLGPFTAWMLGRAFQPGFLLAPWPASSTYRCLGLSPRTAGCMHVIITLKDGQWSCEGFHLPSAAVGFGLGRKMWKRLTGD